ncbi:MAG: uroporphyrinogen-III synthase [Deltaproteobacteria bacterium]|nr:uroporphyrinogen-III synthase [Deltaproteobacteria bacterium]
MVWTRSADDWHQDQILLADCREHVLRLPCVKVCPLAESDVNRQIPPDYYQTDQTIPIVSVFTSSHGAGFFHSLKRVRTIVQNSAACYAVGPATSLRLGDFQVEASVPDGVQKAKDLAGWLADQYRGQDVRFFLPGGRLRAFDLGGSLRRAGFDTLVVNLYETRNGCWRESGGDLDEGERSRCPDIFRSGVICFASPSAVRGFVRYWDFVGRELRSWRVVAIGTSTGDVCQEYFSAVTRTPRPSMEDLKNTAKKLLQLP